MLGMDKVATDNFSTVLTKNLQNPRDYAPLKRLSQRGLNKMYRDQ